ncbi:hypothetical protein GGE65_008149 [Skermanella aerolata]|uniref:DUF7146 domain-containing protein n=1 Tax=Skermanella aerolata TaxID=393310 RepID=UPI003D25C8AE
MSFIIYLQNGKWYDAEADESGDMLSLIVDRMYDGNFAAGRTAAMAFLGETGDAPPPPARPAKKSSVAETRAKQKSDRERDFSELIAKLMRVAKPIAGTVAETYLRRRGMMSETWPDTLLYVPHAHKICYPRSSKVDAHALMVVARDLEGKVRRVQLVFITKDGRKAVVKPTVKPTFHTPGGSIFAVILPAFVLGDDRVQVAEGPETGITAWLATGRETIICLGQIRPDLCPRRPLIILRDADAIGSPADLNIRKRMVLMVIDGHDVRCAMAPRERYNDKPGADMNDVAMAEGMDAVRQVIAAAERVPLPREMLPIAPHWSAPTEGRKAALDRQSDLITAWCAEAALLARIVVEIERLKDGILSRCRRDPDHGLGVINRIITWTDGKPDPASQSVISNQARKAVLRRHGLDRKPEAVRMAVTGSQGSGKTSKALARLASDLTAGTIAWFMQPTSKKAEEAANDYEKLRREEYPAAVPSMTVKGREAHAPDKYLDPDLVKERKEQRLAGLEVEPVHMCSKKDLARKVAEASLSVNRTLCARAILKADGSSSVQYCEHFHDCPYQAQAEEIEKFKITGGMFFLAHDYAYLPPPVPPANLIIADEDLTSKLGAVKSIAEHVIDDLPKVMPPIAAAVLRQIRDAARHFTGIELLWLRDPLLAEETVSDEMRAKVACFPVPEPITAERLEAARHAIETAVEGHLKLKAEALTDEELEVLLEDPDRKTLEQADTVIRQVLREFEQPRPGLVGVWYNPDADITVKHSDGSETREVQPRLQAHYLRRLSFGKATPLLLLDGTGDEKLMRIAYGEDIAFHKIAVERLAEVIQVTSRTFSRQSLTGRRGSGAPVNATSVAEAQKLREQFWHAVKLWGGERNFIAAQKKVEELLEKELLAEPLCSLGHYGLLRGINAYETCDTAFALGREQVSVDNLQSLARAWQADLPDMPVMLPKKSDFPEIERAYRTRGGEGKIGYVEAHPDPTAQAVLEQIREANSLQAIDRVRAIFNQRRIFILSSVPLDITVDRTMNWDEFLRGPDGTAMPPHKSSKAQRPGGRVKLRQAVEAMAKTGVIFLTPAEIYRANPEIYSNALETKEILRWMPKGCASPIEYYWARAPFVTSFRKRVEFQKVNGAGRPSRALIRDDLEPQKALESVGVKVKWVKDVTPTVPAGASVPLEEMFREVVRGRSEWKRVISLQPDEMDGDDFDLREMVIAELSRSLRDGISPRTSVKAPQALTQPQTLPPAQKHSLAFPSFSLPSLASATIEFDQDDVDEFERAIALTANVLASVPVSIDTRLTVRVELYRDDYKAVRRRLLEGETFIHDGQTISLTGDTDAARMLDWTNRRQDLEEMLESMILSVAKPFPAPPLVRPPKARPEDEDEPIPF